MAEKSLIDLLSPSPSTSPSTSMCPGLVSVSIMVGRGVRNWPSGHSWARVSEDVGRYM
jgi:hypothetical protein